MSSRHVYPHALALCALAAACGGTTTSDEPSPAADAAPEGAAADAQDASSEDGPVDNRVCKNSPSVDENDWVEAKNERCCNGMVFVDVMHVGDAGECSNVAPPSVKLCAYCGDGTCVPPENVCNCDLDCD